MNKPFTYVAKTDMSAKKGYAVYLTTDAKVHNTNVVALCAGNEAKFVGIVTDPGVANQAVAVIQEGFVNAILGNTVTKGAKLKTDTNGKLIPATTDKDHVVAVAQAAGGANDVIEVLIQRYDLGA